MLQLFFFLLVLLLYVYVLFPVLLGSVAWFLPKLIRPAAPKAESSHRVTMIIVVHNGEQYIAEKLMNSFTEQYPENNFEVIVVSDGSTDRTVEIVKSFQLTHPIRLLDCHTHQGKNRSINRALRECGGDIIVMTDVSAILEKNALHLMLRWFSIKTVGGVCGRKRFLVNDSCLEQAQVSYLSYEDFIREKESRIASIASNEGFFYAVRRELMHPIPEGVSDDLYTAMSVVKNGFRFIFDPQAYAMLPVRARSPHDELARRRRIVCSSLNGILAMKVLLSPFRFPVYSSILFSHKVLRRIVPVILISLICLTMLLIPVSRLFVFFFIVQVTGVMAFIGQHYFPLQLNRLPGVFRRILSGWYYFCLGNWGTLLGLIDFIRGVKYLKWTPVARK